MTKIYVLKKHDMGEWCNVAASQLLLPLMARADISFSLWTETHDGRWTVRDYRDADTPNSYIVWTIQSLDVL